ncbi:PREDICTED: centromere protein X isoform X1 [Hipposideros armiger]|uniref:Centromere protein X n=1 Tax=Hipposideros armiger TaxID=186990 RepID=A0A8B7SZ23_HIPAR|nr:PREDICTED: centromere protein X isoform X1 [Hipposideros armiger]
MEATSSGFRKELVSKLLHLHFKDDKTKVGGDALLLMAELLKIFVLEAAIRSIRQAQAEDLAGVDVEQLEKVLPQLVASGLLGVSALTPASCLPASQPSPVSTCLLWHLASDREEAADPRRSSSSETGPVPANALLSLMSSLPPTAWT